MGWRDLKDHQVPAHFHLSLVFPRTFWDHVGSHQKERWELLPRHEQSPGWTLLVGVNVHRARGRRGAGRGRLLPGRSLERKGNPCSIFERNVSEAFSCILQRPLPGICSRRGGWQPAGVGNVSSQKPESRFPRDKIGKDWFFPPKFFEGISSLEPLWMVSPG